MEKTIYYYPNNLRSKTQTLFWDFSSFLLIIGLVIASLILMEYTNGSGNWLLLPVLFAFLTIKIENTTIYEKIFQMIKFIICPINYINSNKKNSTQRLIGSQRIDSEGIYTTSSGRYIIWEVSPYNLSVLSPIEIKNIVDRYTTLLTQCPNLETIALDSTSSLENNILYLKNRIKNESNPHIRRLLENDLKSISILTSSAYTTRRYVFVLHLSRHIIAAGNKDIQKYRMYEKAMVDLGFKVSRLGKEEVKSLLANMLDLLTPIPDYDGLQFITKEE